MEANQRAITTRISTLLPRKWTGGAAAMLLGASLILAACGGDTGGDQAATPAGDTTAVTPAAGTTNTTPEVEAEVTVEAEATVETETEVVTDTEATTEEVVITDTAEVTVITDTETTTETTIITDTEGGDESGTITETEEMTATEGVTGTGAAETGAATAATGAATASMMGVTGAQDEYWRATTLLDYSFDNMGGEVSGDLEDLLIDLSTGRVLFASIEYGGVLDLGDKDIVVPLNAFAVGPEGELVLNIDETRLESYPDVGNNWPDLSDPTWDDDVLAFWSETGIAPGTNIEEASTAVAWASDVIGSEVADLGTGAGSVLDILVNVASAQAPYIIVDYGAGLDTDPYILPISAFDVNNREGGLVYGPDFTPDMLEGAPTYNEEQYPEGRIDTEFGDRIESFWNNLGFSNDLNNDGEVD
jgi:hypothetical protein